LVTSAIDTYGWNDALSIYSFEQILVQTEATLEWFIRQLQMPRSKTPQTETIRTEACASALSHADPELLRQRQIDIRSIKSLNDETQLAIEERIQYLTRSPEAIWREFLELRSEQPLSPCHSWSALDRSYRIVEGVARYSTEYAAQVLSILRRSGDIPSSWLDVCAIRLAGEMQLKAAIPCLLDFLGADDLQTDSESRRALVKLGTDRVIAEAALRYPSSTDGFRLGVTGVLEEIRSDSAIQTLRDLLKLEEDRQLRMFLIMAVLQNFDETGIDLARQFVVENRVDVYSAELRSVLFTTCEMMGLRFPEYDAWLADSEENDGDRRRMAFLKKFQPATVLRSGNERVRYPVATIAQYGPNDRVTTKIVVRVVKWPGNPPIVARWMGTGVKDDPKVREQIGKFFEDHRVKSVLMMQECNIGCPHEAGLDFPAGQDCPFCPFWKGRQGTDQDVSPRGTDQHRE